MSVLHYSLVHFKLCLQAPSTSTILSTSPGQDLTIPSTSPGQDLANTSSSCSLPSSSYWRPSNLPPEAARARDSACTPGSACQRSFSPCRRWSSCPHASSRSRSSWRLCSPDHLPACLLLELQALLAGAPSTPAVSGAPARPAPRPLQFTALQGRGSRLMVLLLHST